MTLPTATSHWATQVCCTTSSASGPSMSKMQKADRSITAAASRPAQEQALALLAPGGRLSLFGGLARDDSQISIDSNLVHYRELTIVGVNGSSPAHNREALRLIASGEVVVGDLITHRFPLDRLHDALEAIASGEAIKVTIEPHPHD